MCNTESTQSGSDRIKVRHIMSKTGSDHIWEEVKTNTCMYLCCEFEVKLSHTVMNLKSVMCGNE